jgi:hypothetical protein
MSFPENEWKILLNSFQEPMGITVKMKMPLPMSLLSFPPGRRPYGPEARGSSACGGVTSCPAVDGEVAQSFRQPC